MKRLIIFALTLLFVFSLASCEKHENLTEVPDDFSFSIEWGCNGDSFYDSNTGKLVKQRIATEIEDYTTTFFLSNEQKTEIFGLIKSMNPETYPDEYNPIKGESHPTRNIVISVSCNGKTKTISCKDISLADTPNDSKGEKFIAVHDKIVEMITSSAEWLALPDYEFYYQ